MSIINKLWVKLFAQKVGQDQFGNEYYIGSKKNYLGRRNRCVLYKGIDESSKVPPMWHAWLHYLNESIPVENNQYEWQAEYVPNLSGTKYADKLKKLQCVNEFYSSWHPK
ncbi:MAG: NADH-ubiquinone oxidoreductase subunit NDUFA12 family protein [Rickettsiaceae bacterium]